VSREHPLNELNNNAMNNVESIQVNEEENKFNATSPELNDSSRYLFLCLQMYSGIIRMIEERVGPIIERGDILFTNLRNIQRRRMMRNQSSGNFIPDTDVMGNYQDMIDLEQNLFPEAQGGYSANMIKKIRQIKFIDLTEIEKKNVTDDAVCSICCDNYANTDNVKVLA
jgi:hypothetical protein